MSPCITAWWKKSTMKPGCCWRACILRGHSTGRNSNTKCTSQGTWECEVEAKCVILTFCMRLVRPAYSLTKTLTNQYSASWVVFSLCFLEAENRVCPQTAFIFSSCKFIFQHSYDGFNFTLISLKGKSITEKIHFFFFAFRLRMTATSPCEETGNAAVIFITSTCISWILIGVWKML